MPRDEAAIVDIVTAAGDTLRFVEGLTCEAFLADPRTRAAVLYQLLVVGEASKRLSVEFRANLRDVPWVKIGNLRNVVVHDYNQVDLRKIWDIATRELPLLIERLSPLLPKPSTGEPQ